MKKIMHFFFLSCFKATELIEKKIHLKLSVKEKIQLKTHKMMCAACTKYEKQSILLEKSIAKLSDIKSEPLNLEKLQRRINAQIAKKIDKKN
jgi:hypothetical protein